ncbi:hypothetical protein KI387_009834, partial [Taxus chinensis]
IIKAHPELQIFVGLDVDPTAHEKAKPKLQTILDENQGITSSNLKLNMQCKNFREIKYVLEQVDKNLLVDGVDGIMMDLGMSSMQNRGILKGTPNGLEGREMIESVKKSSFK